MTEVTELANATKLTVALRRLIELTVLVDLIEARELMVAQTVHSLPLLSSMSVNADCRKWADGGDPAGQRHEADGGTAATDRAGGSDRGGGADGGTDGPLIGVVGVYLNGS